MNRRILVHKYQVRSSRTEGPGAPSIGKRPKHAERGKEPNKPHFQTLLRQLPRPFTFKQPWRSALVSSLFFASSSLFTACLESVFICFARSDPGTPREPVRGTRQTQPLDAVGLQQPDCPSSLAGSSRWLATAAAEASSSTPPLPSDPKLVKIVDDISGLTLLQAADLVTLLKVCPCEVALLGSC